MNKKSKVCAVVVTYNRKDCLKETIKGLKEQTYPLTSIFIYDNHSSDGTDKMLQELGFVEYRGEETLHHKNVDNIEWIYYRSSNNSGGSGGFCNGIRLVSEMNFDYIWTMDDDVYPAECCLEELMRYICDEARICIPNRTDERFRDYAVVGFNMTNPFLYKATTRKKKVYAENINGSYITVEDMPFEGPLVALSLIKEIGLPKQELFIIYDDTDYAQRAIKKTELRFVKNAILHKQIIPVKEHSKTMGWKDYYGYRNQIWYDTTYGKNVFVKILRPILLIIELSIRAVVRRKWSNFKVLFKAYRDGTQGKLGKLVEPGTLGEDF